MTTNQGKAGRFPFCLLDKLDRCTHLSQIEQHVNVISDSTDNHIRGIQVANDGCEIGVDAFPNLVDEKGIPISCAEDQMDVQLRQ
jgi:hypothetical protein